jgi:hypothetical protein
LPRNYVQGLDTQKKDLESVRPCYIAGEWLEGGRWYFYLYAACVKIPLGTWLLAVAAIVLTLTCRRFRSFREDVHLLASIVAIVGLASLQSAFTAHFRYVLPALPFAFIFISKLARTLAVEQRGEAWHRAMRRVVGDQQSLLFSAQSFLFQRARGRSEERS